MRTLRFNLRKYSQNQNIEELTSIEKALLKAIRGSRSNNDYQKLWDQVKYKKDRLNALREIARLDKCYY